MRELPKSVRNWLRSWVRLVRDIDIPGYRKMPWLARKRLDCRAFVAAAREPDFWHASLIVLGGALLANILCWRFELGGGQRDLLRSVPFILAAPGAATLRRRLIVRFIKARATDG